MERDFRSMLLGGEGYNTFSPAALSVVGQTTVDTSCFDDVYSGLNLLPLLSLNQKIKPLPTSMDYVCEASPVSLPALPATYGFFSEDVPAIQQMHLNDQKLKSIEKLKMPKAESSDYKEIRDVASTEPFDFMLKITDPTTNLCNPSFRSLPDLRSYEQAHDDFAIGESSTKRAKSSFSPSPDPYSLESILTQLSRFASFKPPERKPPPPPAVVVLPQSSVSQRRRKRISERTRCLQKLLPWDKKMDMATMLEEAYKYIKFLQAQISILQSMPSDSSNPSNFNFDSNFNFNWSGGLERLNRQQLLQVLVNSPVVQTMLYSQGLCVYSIEQLIRMKKMAEMKALYQKMMFDASMLCSGTL